MARARTTTRTRRRGAPGPALPFAAGVAAGAGLARALGSGPARLARMAGSTIAAPDAAGWITDFLNAAYFRRAGEPGADRDVDDLRLALAVVTTRWHAQGHRPLRAADVVAFHRAFGRDRFLDASRSPRGTLDRAQLLAGAARLLGPWFAEAYADDARRGWGIAFPTPAAKAAYRPEDRLEGARLGALTPPEAPPVQQTWHTYPPVRVPSAAGVVDALSATDTWPDYATEVGRFTALRTGGLAGQTFEIEVAAGTAAGRPVPHPRLRDDHARRLGRRRPGRARRLRRRARGRPAALRRGGAASGAGGRRAAPGLRPHDARGALHGAGALDIWSKRPVEDRDPVSRDRIAKLWIESEVLHYTNQRAAAKARVGNPGPEGSIAKLALANMNKLTYELCIDLLGADGIVDYDYTFTRPNEAGLEAPLGSARKMFLRARANSIEGGTSEIMRNILGERILGLPGEPRVDRDLPWSQVPRS